MLERCEASEWRVLHGAWLPSPPGCPPPHTRPHVARLAPRLAQSQSNENIAPSVVMAVAKELRKLTNEPLEGIKVLLNEEDITNIVADIAGPGARRARGLPALDAPLHMAAPLRALRSALWVSPSCGTPPLLGANRTRRRSRHRRLLE